MDKTVLLSSNMYRPNIGGIENSLYHLAQGYLELGYRCIICASDIGPNGQTLLAFEMQEGIEVFRYQVNNKKGVSRFIAHWVQATSLLKKLRKKFQPDVVVCRNHQVSLALICAGFKAFVYLVPGVVKFQNKTENLASTGKGAFSRFSQRGNFILNQFLQSLAFKLSHRVFVFSQNMLSQVSVIRPSIRNTIKVVKPGVDTTRFIRTSSENKVARRETLDLSTCGPVYLCLGRFVQAKGFDLAIEAIQYIPEGTLWIVGEGEECLRYQELIERLSLQDRIKLLPSSSEPEAYYAAADFFVMSSRYEPLGQTILEALSSGLPIIAFDDIEGITTATSELLRRDEVFLAEELTGKSLAITMKQAAEIYGGKEYNNWADKSRNKAVLDFRWTNLCKELL